MSEHGEQVGALYKNGANTDFGKHLRAWIELSMSKRRAYASKLEPIPAWGELKFADGLEEVIKHIEQMSGMAKDK